MKHIHLLVARHLTYPYDLKFHVAVSSPDPHVFKHSLGLQSFK